MQSQEEKVDQRRSDLTVSTPPHVSVSSTNASPIAATASSVIDSGVVGGSGRKADISSSSSVSGISSGAGGTAGGSKSNILKLLLGAGGIFVAFSYYGVLHEDIFKDEAKFSQSWYLQALEASANVLVGGFFLKMTGSSSPLPQKFMFLSGLTQVSSKSFTSSALAANVSFPLVTLAKSGKMIPIMIGSLLMGGKSYTIKEYLSVLAIIVGTCLVSLGKSKGADTVHSSKLGVLFILLSLVCDGITGGVQNKIRERSKELGNESPGSWNLMFNTNLYMALVAVAVSLINGELTSGTKLFVEHPDIFTKVLQFALCSAVGQSFIFYTISNFGPLTCSTVTTSRKVFSVLLSLFYINKVTLSLQQRAGLLLACVGIFSELHKEATKPPKHGTDDDKKAG